MSQDKPIGDVQIFKSVGTLSGGFSNISVAHVVDTTGSHFVIKSGNVHANVNAVLVSEFLKIIFPERSITLNGEAYQFYVPTITMLNSECKQQKQEYLDGLKPDVGTKKIQGLSSLDSLEEAAEFGAVYQFLMMGDNISHNHRISSSYVHKRFNIFDFDSSILLGGDCITSTEGIFHDHVVAVGSAYNDHFIDILAHRLSQDKYDYINFQNALYQPLRNETWHEFFRGVKKGLELIKQQVTEQFLTEKWGAQLPESTHTYLDHVKQLVVSRFKNLDMNIVYLDALLNEKITIPGIEINKSIRGTLSNAKSITLDQLKKTIAEQVSTYAAQTVAIQPVLAPIDLPQSPSVSAKAITEPDDENAIIRKKSFTHFGLGLVIGAASTVVLAKAAAVATAIGIATSLAVAFATAGLVLAAILIIVGIIALVEQLTPKSPDYSQNPPIYN